MHLILKSSQAKGAWSFRYRQNPERVTRIILKFAKKYGVTIQSLANVGNHLHMQIKLSNRVAYFSFIRAITSAIAMAVTGKNRWNQVGIESADQLKKFWDYRPYSRVVMGWKALLTLRDYIEINKWEGDGCSRAEARIIVAAHKMGHKVWSTA